MLIDYLPYFFLALRRFTGLRGPRLRGLLAELRGGLLPCGHRVFVENRYYDCGLYLRRQAMSISFSPKKYFFAVFASATANAMIPGIMAGRGVFAGANGWGRSFFAAKDGKGGGRRVDRKGTARGGMARVPCAARGARRET